MKPLIVIALALVVASCSSDPRPAPRTGGWPWQAFPDVPLPAGWLPESGRETAWAVIAGGTIRRLDAVVVGESPQAETAAEYRLRLERAGWIADQFFG